ncbi:hypothetical protein [Curtobacterium sp. MCBD17_040]|uniref:hypothetical protein n=1 Tax=Curtobacterium sp. MCBD17_040 TaxID=2175674 RepID=UPI0024DF4704|nr:hypothetical protein [Curtobacterium sp. MCBD17_040]WIB65753.1 hypothetical protein DEI94_16680 [Curtobacterium sp. MCBD17_040]
MTFGHREGRPRFGAAVPSARSGRIGTFLREVESGVAVSEMGESARAARRGAVRLIVGLLSAAVIVPAGLAFWDWEANRDNPPRGSIPSAAQTQQLQHELVDGLKRDDRALFMKAATYDPKAGAEAWRVCEPWASRARIVFDPAADVDPKAPDLQVHVAGNLHEGCYVGVEWVGSPDHPLWDFRASKGLEPSDPNPNPSPTR